MKTKFYLDGKKTTKKALAEKIGKERLDRMVGEAEEGFFADPMEQQSFHLGSAGMLTIEFAKTVMKDFTTIEKLQKKVSAAYGSVLKFGDHVLVTDACYKGGFTADIYEFVETPEETGLGDIECRLNHIGSAGQTFSDNGHAIKWCMEQVAK